MTTLQIADKSCRKPMEFIKYVLIEILMFSLPIDFMVLDIKANTKIYLLF